MPSPNGAGDLPLDVELKGVLQIKKGDIQENPRGGAKHDIVVRVSDGYGVLRARMDTIVRPLGVSREFEIYFKKTKNGVQSSFLQITDDNFEEYLRARWAKITMQEVAKWKEEDDLEPRQVPIFEFFIYKPKERQREGAARIQRATAARIQRARQELQAYQRNNNLPAFGRIQQNHLSHVNARRPDGAELVIPDDATNRQAAALDREIRQVEQETDEARARRDAEMKPLVVEISGQRLEIKVSVKSLRDALGLPPYNLFHEGIFHQHNHENIDSDEDQDDDEHAAPQPGQDPGRT